MKRSNKKKFLRSIGARERSPRKLKKRNKKRNKKLFTKIHSLVTPIKRILNYQSIARQTFKVEQLPEGSNLIYYSEDETD